MCGDMGDGFGVDSVVPWAAYSLEDRRREFVRLAGRGEVSVSELCRRFEISRKTGYKWLGRAKENQPLSDRSRRPLSSPTRCPEEVEAQVLAVREAHPAWGGRKIRAWLLARNLPSPSASGVTEVLRRHGKLNGPGAGEKRDWVRFEREAPNELWQMDFKGHFALGDGARCHPLTLEDDHSRYSLLALACKDERSATVKEALEATFRLFGLPQAILCDNGGCWGSGEAGLNETTVWLYRLGVRTLHGRPRHPQTQGKLERFHQTLKLEALQGPPPKDMAAAKAKLEAFRRDYNFERPHESLGMKTPSERYTPSLRPFPERLAQPEYAGDVQVRKVQQGGIVHFKGKELKVPLCLIGLPVGLKPTLQEERFEILFCDLKIREIDLSPQ